MKLPNWPSPTKIDKTILGLDRIKILLKLLGNVHKKLPPIFHIAGTNGKGSVSSYLKYILEFNNYKVHRYTSPHLVNFNERIEIAGKIISDNYYNELAEECKNIIDKNNLQITYFEAITAIAFMAFSRNNADVLILEVGMGGRLDATNIIDKPLMNIVTTISLDHTEILGKTINKIAFEKAGIFKSNCPVVLSKQKNNALKVFLDEAKKNNCKVYQYNKDWNFKQINKKECLYTNFNNIKFKTVIPNLLGKHQIMNAGTAISALLNQNKLKISEESINKGLQNTKWKARLENLTNSKFQKYLNKNDILYLDGCHNEDGARVVTNWLKQENLKDKRNNIAIISMLQRKDTRKFIKNIKLSLDRVILINNEDPKYKQIDEFKNEFLEENFKSIEIVKDIFEAFNKTKNTVNNRIIICGSLYFAGDILALLEEL